MIEKTLHLSIDEDHDGIRLDKFLVEQLGISRTKILAHIKQECVVNGANIPFTKGGIMLKTDTEVVVHPLPAPAETVDEETSAPDDSIYQYIKIIAETDDYLVISKPAGLLVHPSNEKQYITLAHWLKRTYPEIISVGEDKVRPGIVHRLDKETSGVMVVAKTQRMFDLLKTQFQSRTVKKIYHTLVHGIIEPDHDILDFLISRGVDGKMASRPNVSVEALSDVRKVQEGKQAKTEFWVEKRFINHTWLRVQIHTGRTHQIRVHMFAYNHPVAGDKLYIQKKLKEKDNAPRMFLHAAELSFDDIDGKRVTFVSHVPDKMREYINTLSA
ncbi:MAG: RluA family pseudouridine synthase [Candidatus Magasanikbacteria bacterium]|jgi:23S rRNA pseudouridine1911/1915/1917 synthase|nr:RluA family pseudouridine synthase [Candidatus Magasanikbacteria bacterium]MBT4071198.1 RluA family pseudouridine synthase [Candidatus Magasanikbacteria bacterium]